jgi:LPXTG-motif cell wall-anchored protein
MMFNQMPPRVSGRAVRRVLAGAALAVLAVVVVAPTAAQAAQSVPAAAGLSAAGGVGVGGPVSAPAQAGGLVPAAAGPAPVASAAAARLASAAAGPLAASAVGVVSGGSDPVVVSLDDGAGVWFEDLTVEFFGDSSWLWTPADSKVHTVYVRNDSEHVAWGEARVVISEPAGGLWDAAVVVGGGSPTWVGAPAGQQVVASAALTGVGPGVVTRLDLWVRVDPDNVLSPRAGVGAVIDAEVVLSGGPEDDQDDPTPAPTPDPETAPAPTPTPTPSPSPSLSSSAPSLSPVSGGVGGLPVTGAEGVGLVGVAGGLLSLGWWLVVAARRRRDARGGES